jgi:hypothetical protein
MQTVIKSFVQFAIIVKLSASLMLLTNAVLSLFFSLIVPNCTFLDVFQSPLMVFITSIGLIATIIFTYVELSLPKYI